MTDWAGDNDPCADRDPPPSTSWEGETDDQVLFGFVAADRMEGVGPDDGFDVTEGVLTLLADGKFANGGDRGLIIEAFLMGGGEAGQGGSAGTGGGAGEIIRRDRHEGGVLVIPPGVTLDISVGQGGGSNGANGGDSIIWYEESSQTVLDPLVDSPPSELQAQGGGQPLQGSVGGGLYSRGVACTVGSSQNCSGGSAGAGGASNSGDGGDASCSGVSCSFIAGEGAPGLDVPYWNVTGGGGGRGNSTDGAVPFPVSLKFPGGGGFGAGDAGADGVVKIKIIGYAGS